MNNFRTEIRIPKSAHTLDHYQKILSIGSCFAEHMHARLRSAYFNTLCNPCGIVYNPASIGHQMLRLLDGKTWCQDDLLFDQGLYHGLHHHGSFSHQDPDLALEYMNTAHHQASLHLKSTDCVLVTLGSSIVYHHYAKDVIVANCHKIPLHHFNRKILSVDEIVQISKEWIQVLVRSRPGVHIIFTISPVRYLKEGFIDNTRSKSRLAIAIEMLCQFFPQVHYFPSYEIILDDLRDYRFYKEDMIHPSDQAIDYIWELFIHSYMNKSTEKLINELKSISMGLAHRPLHPDSPAHEKFKIELDKKIMDIKHQFPFIQFGLGDTPVPT